MSWEVAAGAAVGGLMSRFNASHNAALSKDLWKYQQSNAHQLEVEDLRNAGLNPILSATNGQIAGMPSVSGSDNGIGSSLVNAITSLKLKSMELDNDKKRQEIEWAKANTEAARLSLDSEKWNLGERPLFAAQTGYYDASSNFYSAKAANDTILTNARVKQILSDTANSVRLTSAQISNLNSQSALNYKMFDKINSDIAEAASRIGLNNQQVKLIKADLDSLVRKASEMRAKDRVEYLNTGFGKVLSQFGIGLDLVNPFDAIGGTAGGLRYGSHR